MKNDKNRKNWFKRRRYGYGWTPVTWQGWSVIGLFLVVVFSGAIVLLRDTPRNTLTIESLIFLAFTVIAVILAITISLMKGPKPKWRWGSKSTDNSDEDI